MHSFAGLVWRWPSSTAPGSGRLRDRALRQQRRLQPPATRASSTAATAVGRCQTCGVVQEVQQVYVERQEQRHTLGAIIGAVAGGVLGNTVGKGDGRKAATVAGAVAGGVVGNQVGKRNGGGDVGLAHRCSA